MFIGALIWITASILCFIHGLNEIKLRAKLGWFYQPTFYSLTIIIIVFLSNYRILTEYSQIWYVLLAYGWSFIGRSLLMIGLTGSVGCGKSAVTSIVKSEFSQTIAIIDCDLVSREVVIPGRWAYKKIVKAFGTKILDSKECIDRNILGAIVFSNKTERSKLDRIIQPAIFIEIFKKLIYFKLKGYSYVMIDAPILFETKILPWFCFLIITVYVSDEELQIERVMNRDVISKEEAIQKIKCQWPIEIKLRKSNIVIDNVGTFEELKEKTQSIFKNIINGSS